MTRTGLSIRSAWSIAVSALVLGGCGEKIEAPTSFQPFDAKDGAFSGQYPEGWEAKFGAGQGTGYSWAKFTKGNAEIKIDTSFAGSLIGDITKAGQAGLSEDDVDESSTPVAQVLDFKRPEMDELFSDYQEKTPVTVQSGLGQCRVAEFTAGSGFGGKVHGFRAAMLSNDRAIIVVCYCPEKSWKMLKPAFEKVITSVKR
jgi:hypothetical protein